MKHKFSKIPKYPIGYDKNSVPNAIKRGEAKRKALESYAETIHRRPMGNGLITDEERNSKGYKAWMKKK